MQRVKFHCRRKKCNLKWRMANDNIISAYQHLLKINFGDRQWLMRACHTISNFKKSRVVTCFIASFGSGKFLSMSPY